jgi:hypothetical protein
MKKFVREFVKEFLWPLFAAILLFVVLGCTIEYERLKEVRESQRLERLQSKANEVVHGILYFKDPRTNLCFAYYWGGGSFGGPALTTVPCDLVPPELLIVAE